MADPATRPALPSRKRHRYKSFKQQVQEVCVGCPESGPAPVLGRGWWMHA
ncbi:MAG: hypothetical protein ABGY24_07205 [bacterium]